MVCNELGVLKYKWRQIGAQLGIPHYKLEEFAKKDDSLATLVDYWLCGNVEGVPPSWQSIVKALESSHVGERGLARRIGNKYCGKEGDKGKCCCFSSHFHWYLVIIDWKCHILGHIFQSPWILSCQEACSYYRELL